MKEDGSPSHLTFVFTCKTDPTRHKPITRRRSKSSEGTSNLQLGVSKCLERNGGAIQAIKAGTLPYSVAAHRTLIALHCAKNHRPFNSVLDEEYLQEVEMLRPGTVVPHPITVSRDIKLIYLELSKQVREFFKVSKIIFNIIQTLKN